MLFVTMYEYAHLPTGSMSLLTKKLCAIKEGKMDTFFNISFGNCFPVLNIQLTLFKMGYRDEVLV